MLWLQRHAESPKHVESWLRVRAWSERCADDDSIDEDSHSKLWLLQSILFTASPRAFDIPTMESSLARSMRALSRHPIRQLSLYATEARCRPAALTLPCQARWLHSTRPALLQSRPPKTRDRGPKSNEDTQTDFSALDVLRNTAAPATSIDACTGDGFALNNQMRISGSGILLVGGEAYRWRPWLQQGTAKDAMTGKLLNPKGQWEVPEEAWGVLELVYPKPGMSPSPRSHPSKIPANLNLTDLLIIGTGPNTTPIAPAVRKYLNDLGIRLEIQDTRNAAAQFNLLATERGVGQVAAALIPIGWRERR